MPQSPPEALAAELERLVRAEQARQRLPSLTAAVVRAGEPLWETAVGLAHVERATAATPDTQYRVGSITKTFTAAAIMQLRDAGKLDLDDALSRHIDGAARAPTIRRLLSHTSGLQREPPGDVWETLSFSPPAELLERLGEAEQVHAAGARWHYSNLAFSLLGIVVERASGLPYEQYVRERILGPLGLDRTTLRPEEPAAQGYLRHPYADAVWQEAPVETASWIPAGQMWGTVRDLCRWAAFLARPDEAVLREGTVEEMRTVQAISDHEHWTGGYGLGLMLRREGERILAGHTGSMPGFIAAVYASPQDRIGAAALTNESSAGLGALAAKLAVTVAEQFPAEPEEWRVAESVPDELRSVLGAWFMEGSLFVFAWRKGRLEATEPDYPDDPPSVFARETADRFRTVSGAEHGEQLRLVRDDAGRVVRMSWATYPLTREPRVWAVPPE